jgi:alkaline phosphatase
LVTLGSETHAGEDIAIYGKGPGGHWVAGTNEQSAVFHVMNKAAKLVFRAEKQLRN